jgi:splicing factor 4
LPPEELAKFMEKFQAVQEGRTVDESDYKEFKIAESNVGKLVC